MNNLNLVQGVYDAFAKGDIPVVIGFLSPDIDWTEAEGFPYGGTYRGPDAVLEGVFMRLGTEWEGFAAVPDEFIVAVELAFPESPAKVSPVLRVECAVILEDKARESCDSCRDQWCYLSDNPVVALRYVGVRCRRTSRIEGSEARYPLADNRGRFWRCHGSDFRGGRTRDIGARGSG